MKILAIESSADDTGIAILECTKAKGGTAFTILASKVHTQIDIHTQYGGIFPMMAKREHGKNMTPTLTAALKEAKMLTLIASPKKDTRIEKKLRKILERENDLVEPFMEFIAKTKKPKIDAIAVTVGPGLEPALWVGISTARALSFAWDVPIIPVNHMEGHLLSIIATKKKTFTYTQDTLQFPLLSLLVSGGHTEIVLMREFGKYKVVGQTRDDAAGEAFDKVARMLDLPYPGGPEISRLAREARTSEFKPITFPRPMLYTKDFDFSFSGLKTAVLYYIRDNPIKSEDDKKAIACEFEDAVIEVLTTKMLKAIKKYNAKTVLVGGGVSANALLKETLTQKVKIYDKKIKVHFPTSTLATDNALMIAIAGFFQSQKKKPIKNSRSLKATGNLHL